MASCNDTPTCLPCNPCTPCDPCSPDYTDTGCCDFIKTDCVIYKGEDIDCLNISTNESLTDILTHLQEIVCALAPAGYSEFDFGCFASEGITTEQQFVEFITSVICEILGTQNPGGITSLSDLYALIQSLTTQLNLIKTQSIISCFQTLGSLGTTANISNLLTAIQTILCDHEDRIVALESGSVNTNITVVNTNHDVVLQASGTNNHTLSADVLLDPDADNALTTSSAGVMVLSPEITVVDSQSVNLSRSGLHNHTITADVRISATAGNAASILADGIYVADATTSETPITAIDSNSIDITTSGTNDHTITADIILDPSLLNIAQITANGLFVSSALVQDPITPIDSPSINLTVTGGTGHTLRGDVQISATSNNAAVVLSDGLYVPDPLLSSTGWLLTGNAGTNSSTDFIGTTDNVSLNFRVNNVASGKINSTAHAFFGYQAGLANLSAAGMTAVGYQALKANTTGTENSAFGHNSLYINTTGYDNAAFGGYSLSACTTGYGNSAFGHRSGNALTTGFNNTLVGSQAGEALTTGSYNTFIGLSSSTSLVTVSKSIVLGYNAEVSANNQAVIGGIGSDAVSVVVGGTAADTSALIDLISTDKGALIPRMTSVQRDAIASPAEGLLVWNKTTADLNDYNGSAWRPFRPQHLAVTAQFDKVNTTLANITGLSANVVAGKKYEFEVKLYTTSDVGGGVKASIGGTATATSIIYEALVYDGATLAAQTRATSLASPVGGVTAVTAAYITITGTIVVNAGGTLTVQFAENAAVNTSSVLVGSTFKVTEII